MQPLDWIMRRKSVRAYTNTPIPAPALEQLLRAGMAAPAAVNQQLWEFVVVDQPALLQQLGEVLPYAKMLLHAPAAILVCGNLQKTFNNDPNSPYWIMDCSAATENILLAAEALGLGAVWTAIYPDAARVETVQRILGLPAHVLPLNALPLGYPAVDEPPKDKWNPAAVHHNGW